jgi:glyoxylase-like metal-dependent hydrolase (beta-lactamase superfamily II)
MRPRALLACLLLTVVAMSQPASESPRAAAPQPALKPLRVGDLEVWTLRDGQIPLEGSLLRGLDAAEIRRRLGGQDAALTPVNAFLVRRPGRTVLVDTGMGAQPGEDGGHLGAQLAAAGVAPGEVDLVLLTHFHFDHLGGLLKADGTRAFPKAQLRVPREEYRTWVEEPSGLPERLRDRAPKLRALFEVYAAAGAFGTFAEGDVLAPGLRVLPARGHTGGHTAYAFTSGDQELWCIGDLIHFGAVQVDHPEVGIAFDLDGDRAVRIRQELFREAARIREAAETLLELLPR